MMSAVQDEGIVRAMFNVLTRYAFRRANSYSRTRFGFLERILFIACQDASYVEKLHIRINLWSDGEILAWKTSLITNCNSISVAAAVFAGIGLTALQLPNLEQTHWTAQAFFSTSMAVGVLSVVCATDLQRNIIMCNSALEIRCWLSNGRPRKQLEERYRGLKRFKRLPLESSVSAAMMCELPALLLKFAVVLYFAGFSIYLLFNWINRVEENDQNGSRNVFIFFVVAIGLFSIQMLNGKAMRDLDQAKRNFNYGGNGSDTYLLCPGEEDDLQVLKASLDKLSALCNADT